MRRFVLFLCTFLLAAGAYAQEQRQEDWSELLDNLLKPLPEASKAPTEGGFVPRSYQLRNLKVGSPGKADRLVSILGKMLSADSRITEEPQNNALNIYTTVKAHDAVRDLISSFDTNDEEGSLPAKNAAPAAMPEEVKKSLLDLAGDNKQIQGLVNDVARKYESMGREFAIQSERQTKLLLSVGSAVLITVLAVGLLILRRNKKAIIEASKATAALVPTVNLDKVLQISNEQQLQQAEFKAIFEKMGIVFTGMQHQQKEFIARVQADRQALIESIQSQSAEGSPALRVVSENMDTIRRFLESSERVSDAAEKMEATAAKLDVHDKRMEEMAKELDRALREQHELHKRVQEIQQQAQRTADENERLREENAKKAEELTKKEAMIAAISVVMQEPVDVTLSTLNAMASEKPKEDEQPPSSPRTDASSTAVSGFEQPASEPKQPSRIFHFSPPNDE